MTDDGLGPRITSRRLTPGPYDLDSNDRGVCAKCGREGGWPEIIRTELKDWPGRVSRRCADSIACVRRRNRKRDG